MTKREKVEESMLGVVAKRIKNDNKTVDELIDKIMKEVDVWVEEHKKDWDELSIEDQSTLTEPTYLVRKVAEIKYAKSSLRENINKNLSRAMGNLGEESRVLAFYDTFTMFNYSCPYSGTLLIGGEQQIHIDHIIPVTMGGPTDDWNCIPVCASCNTSKNDRHLLDWWQDNRTQQEEYKLVKIFEYMTSKLLDEKNQIKYIKNADVKKHLDVITFLNQLLEHIEENKEYIFEQGFESEQEKTKEIQNKLKELKSTFERVVQKNNKNTKTNQEYYTELKEMVNYVKSFGVRSYYKIAYTYFNEIQEMQDAGLNDEEIKEFCFSKEECFNFQLFYERLIQYKKNRGSFDGITMDKEIGWIVSCVRQAYKGKGNYKLTQEMIDKLEAIDFVWEVDKVDWFTPFYEKLKIYKDKEIKDEKGNIIKVKGSFDDVSVDHDIGYIVRRVRYAFHHRNEDVSGLINLTPEMIDALILIDFPWRITYKDMKDRHFNRLFNELCTYKETYGNFDHVLEDEDLHYKVARLRREYRNGILSFDRIEKLNSIGFTWKDNGYDDDNVRVIIKKFVKQYLEFVSKYNHYPRYDGDIPGETALYDKWKRRTNTDDLNIEEIEYLKQHNIDVRKKGETIRPEVKQFVNEWKILVPKYGLPTRITEDIRIRALYGKWVRYRDPDNLNQNEIDYLQQNGIDVRNDEFVREVLKNFIQKYKIFVQYYQREPRYIKKPKNNEEREETNLHSSYKRYTNEVNLKNDTEKTYIRTEISKIRSLIEVQEVSV